MTPNLKRTLIVIGTSLIIYFALYFALVKASYYSYKGAVLPEATYRISDSNIAQLFFAPANLLDSAYLRPAMWEMYGTARDNDRSNPSETQPSAAVNGRGGHH
jgi:hypothetical protein